MNKKKNTVKGEEDEEEGEKEEKEEEEDEEEDDEEDGKEEDIFETKQLIVYINFIKEKIPNTATPLPLQL